MPNKSENFNPKKPDFVAYTLREGDTKTYNTRIGAAWTHNDGKGFSIHVEAIPLDGKIHLREISESK